MCRADIVDKLLTCTCCMYEHYGIPYHHIVCAIKCEHLNELLRSLICRHWIKGAKSAIPEFLIIEEHNNGLRMLCYGALSFTCNRICYLVA